MAFIIHSVEKSMGSREHRLILRAAKIGRAIVEAERRMAVRQRHMEPATGTKMMQRSAPPQRALPATCLPAVIDDCRRCDRRAALNQHGVCLYPDARCKNLHPRAQARRSREYNGGSVWVTAQAGSPGLGKRR
jgi:hypothetical protein